MKKIALALVLVLCTALTLSAQRKAGIYSTAETNPRIAKFVESTFEEELKSQGGDYKIACRSESFLKLLTKEHAYQRSGFVDDSQIAELGKQEGVDVVFAFDVDFLLSDLVIIGRLVNVETAESEITVKKKVKAADLEGENATGEIEKAVREMVKKMLYLD